MPVDYFTPTEFSRYHRAWYARPWFYLPLALVVVVLVAGLLAFIPTAVGLRQQAAALDLSHLEKMESASVIVDRSNKIFGQIYVENRETVPLRPTPPNLVNAVIAMEDNKFYQHHGYDLLGIIRAALKNTVAGHVRQGASTITQQLARNSYDLKGKTFRRKLLEMFVARRIEGNFSKQKIMELYLNRIYFGGGLYGAEAAARGYFDKPAREMSLRNAPPSPGWSRVLTNCLPGRIRPLRAKRAISSSAACASSASSTPSNWRTRAGGGAGDRQPAKCARTKLRDRLHPPAGDRRGRVGSGA